MAVSTALTKRAARARSAKHESKPAFHGWKTTDEEEIERRRLRASVEAIGIEALEPDQPVYGTFAARSLNGNVARYLVEIRSLADFQNSCTCPDYNVNGLGTCKHIEAVLAGIRKNRAGHTMRDEGSNRIEIYLS